MRDERNPIQATRRKRMIRMTQHKTKTKTVTATMKTVTKTVAKANRLNLHGGVKRNLSAVVI